MKHSEWRSLDSDSDILNQTCKSTVAPAFSRNKKTRNLAMFFLNKALQFTPPPDVRKFYIPILQNKLWENCNFFSLVFSYENIVKVYNSYFSFKFGNLWNTGVG